MEEQYTLEEWLGMMEEGKLSRLAAGVGLGAAAMMGGAKDAEAQAKSEPAPTTTTRSWTSTMGRNSDGAPTPPKDSTSTQTSRDMQMAVDKAAFDLKSRGIDPRTVAGFKRDIKQNPDGTWSVTMKPDTTKPPMDESRTLEEWMSVLKEAGYDLGEVEVGQIVRPNYGSHKGKAHKVTRVHPNSSVDTEPVDDPNSGHGYLSPKTYDTDESYTLEEWMGKLQEAGVNLNELSPELLKRYVKASKADMQKNLAKSTEKTLNVPGRARAERRFQGQTAAFKRLGGDPDLAEGYTDESKEKSEPKEKSLNENTVSRLQQLAGIVPLN